MSRHGALYAAEYGRDATFEAPVARIVGEFDGSRDAAWVAERDGERTGCAFCCHEDDTTARLRMLLVEPPARGSGVGRRLVEECVRHARRAGCTRITLWTDDVLASARRLYVDAGFTPDREEPHRSFGRDLVGRHWSTDLWKAESPPPRGGGGLSVERRDQTTRTPVAWGPLAPWPTSNSTR